jgi:hypothetical protein
MENTLDTKTLEKFFRNINTDENDCWLWQGKTIQPDANKPYVYGWFAYGISGKVYRMVAHRYAYKVLKNNSIGKTHLLWNTCGNTLCVNPDHWKTNAPSTKPCSAKHQASPNTSILVKYNNTGKVAFLCPECHQLLGIRQTRVVYV